MSDVQNNVQNTNIVTAISTNILHSTLNCLFHVISNGVRMPQITKYEFIKIKVQIDFTFFFLNYPVTTNSIWKILKVNIIKADQKFYQV